MADRTSDQRSLLEFLAKSFAEDMSLLSGITFDSTVTLTSNPTVIYDLNGAPLFLEYRIVDSSGAMLGRIRSSARGENMPLVDSIALGRLYYDEQVALQGAKAKSADDLPNSSYIDARFVCYGYPRIGVLVRRKVNGDTWSVVYDATAGVFVRKWRGDFRQAGAEAGPLRSGALDGQPFYSYLQFMSQSADLLERGVTSPSVRLPSSPSPRFGKQWAAFRNLARPARPVIPPFAAFAAPLPGQRSARTAEARVEPPPASPRICIRGTILPALRIGQQTPVFCAVATVQMILSYLGVADLSQDRLAQALHTGPDGTTNENLLAAIPRLTNGKWKARIVMQPTFEENVRIAEALVPAKSAIPGHARLLRGWREYSFMDANGSIVHKQSFYVVNDPYPMNIGEVVLEAVENPIPDFHVNSVYLERAQ